MFRSLTTEEASHVERWQAPRIGEPARVKEGVQSPLHEIDIDAVTRRQIPLGTEAVSLMNESSPPSAAIVQEAYDEGYAIGLAEAEQRSRQREVEMLEPVIKLIEHQVSLDELARSEALIDLSKAMAALILHREIREDPDVLTLFVNQALDALDVADGVPEVRMNPSDLALISEINDSDSAVAWKPDNSLPRGSCILDSGASRIRNGIVEQLERVIVDMDLTVPVPVPVPVGQGPEAAE